MVDWDLRWRQAALWFVGAIVAVPLFVAWAFLVYDLGSGGGPDRWLKMLYVALLTIPLLWLLGRLALGIARRRTRHGIPPAGWLGIGGSAVLALLVLAVAGFTAAIEWRQPEPPPAFYDAPELSNEAIPGMVLRSEPLEGAPPGSRAWRILYTSHDATATPVAVSGIVVVPDSPPPADGRPIVAWAHPTVGVARNCAPSLRSNWAERIHGLDLLLERGYVVVASDYVGLGGEGRHPYLVGRVAAANLADAVRATRDFEQAEAGHRYAVWGASQGGHAALHMGAPGSVPDLELVGIAAAAPPTDLKALFAGNLGTPFGNVLASLAFTTWPHAYDGVEMDQVVEWAARPVVRNISTYCFLQEEQTAATAPGVSLLDFSFTSHDPVVTEPWSALLDENSPRASDIHVPLFIAQGEADPLVVELVTGDFVEELCRRATPVEYRTYRGIDHVAIGPESAPDAVAWIAARFAGTPPPTTCE